MVDGPNMYTYVNNNPVNFVDPWGLCGTDKSKHWGPEWLEKLIPDYEGYGGPDRTDLTFKTRPTDSMDEIFMQHDFLWFKGYGKQADTIIFSNLVNLPLNPYNWENKPRNLIWAVLYRESAIIYFGYKEIIKGEANDKKTN